MRFLLALAACLLAAPTSWTLSLYGFNQVKYLENLDLKLAKSSDQQQQQLSPVILVPGDGGSRIDANLDKTAADFGCYRKTDQFYDIWLNKEQLAPWDIDCWSDNLRLVYNNVTRKTSNSPGVTIRFPGWGYSETVEWIDTSHAAVSAYYVNLANALVQNGYHRGVSIRGAPYDFRKAPSK
uniref:Group XV phospholipase A2 n=1 Tax=Culex pipiens TaxID=7175 RepID=A0A8D8BUJ3_CULPI